MFKIDWYQLEKNIEAGEVSFENFNFQIAVKKYSFYGKFEYYHNTPGSEFYLTLTKDCAEFSAKAGDVIGWQVKFWLNKKALDNSPLDSNHRDELIADFKKSLEYKPDLKVWIICTPGRFINTAQSYPVNELEKSLKSIKPNINILYWYKEQYESIFHSAPEQYASIFNHCFSKQYLGFHFFCDRSSKRLDILRKRYDTDLYTPGREDKKILSSIFYKDLLEKLNDKIKHTIEYGEKLSRSRLYREIADKFITSPDIDSENRDIKEEIEKIKALIDELLSLFEQLRIYNAQENTLQFTKQLFNIIETRRERINALWQEAGVPEVPDYEIDISYEPDIKDVYNVKTYLYSLAGSFIDKTKEMYRLLFHISRQVFNVFAEAGFGKTNFACSITELLLSKQLPVLLIPASEIRGNGESVEKQILGLLGIDLSITFKDFIGMLDSAGFLHGIKIPIIIDGLNEAQPSASAWNPQLQYIIKDIENYENVILITTCRNAYVKQVFDSENIDDAPYAIKLEGFQENIDEAIKKYFKKYKITPENKNFDRNILKNPLLLRIFSIANKGKTADINESNIYIAVESYINEIVKKVSTQNGSVNPIYKNQVSKGIRDYCIQLWETNSRGISYPDELIKYFDPSYISGAWQETNTSKIVDEGLLFRNIHAEKEYAEFTHDLIGGYCIAKNVIFSEKNSGEIVSTLKSDELLGKLTSGGAKSRHPLAEDILKAIVFLCPQCTGKELFELIDNIEVLKASLLVIRIIISRKEGQKSLIKHFKTIKPENPILPHLLESVLLEILKREEYIGLTDLLKAILLRLKPNQIDLNWSEVIRRKSDEIIPYLYREIEQFETNKENRESVGQKLLLISLLLSSTNRYLRDNATKALVTVGKKYPGDLFDVFLSLEGISDLYILERLIASICGVFLQIDNKELLIQVCTHLEDNYFKRIKTTHILILDYIDTLLDYAAIHFRNERSALRPPADHFMEWQKDIECTSAITDDGRAEWGFGPVDYDFAKYKIGSYLSSRGFKEDSKLPTIKESLAMVVWKAKELGYSEDLFHQLDIQINKDIYEKYGSSGMIQPYGKKYIKIAFYELFGHNLIKGLCRDFKDEVGFRVPVTDIDPTFPRKPRKRQLITYCFLPKKSEDIQEWINDDRAALFQDYYVRTDIGPEKAEWIMLYGHLVQESSEKSRINISVYTIGVHEGKCDDVIEQLNKNEIFMPHLIAENHYVMSGEIPWSKNYLDGLREEGINGESIELYLPVSSYLRESKTNLAVIYNAPVLSKELAQSLGLRINLNDFNLYTASNELASTYLHDDYSRFLYMRADLVKKYLEETEQSLIWFEIASKDGAFGEHKPKYNPSFKDLRTAKRYVF